MGQAVPAVNGIASRMKKLPQSGMIPGLDLDAIRETFDQHATG